MPASIRGHNVNIKIFKDGGEVDILTATQFDVNQDANFSRSFDVGRSEGEGDTTYMGFSGSLTLEVKSAALEEMLDDIVQNNLNGIGVSDVTILDTEFYSDGTSKTYVYYGIQLKYSRSVGTMESKVTKKIDWQADGRQAV